MNRVFARHFQSPFVFPFRLTHHPSRPTPLVAYWCVSFLKTCLPLSLILDGGTKGEDTSVPLGPRRDQNACCPACSGTVRGIHVVPLSFEALKRSVQLRVAEAKASGAKPCDGTSSTSGNKRDRSDSEVCQLEVEAAQVVFSQGNSSSSSDADSRRTGRWTDEELEYVDHLLKAFDKGQLPLSHGTKLANFLGSALLCKATRLTKKMKNAKLGIRNFAIQPATLQTNANSDEASVMKVLQDRFVMSLPSEYSRLELEYNLSMHWRTCFSDLCVQVGYPHLDGSSFISSLEEYERLAANAEEGVRVVRRRRLAGGFTRVDQPTLGVESSSIRPSIGPTSFSGGSFLPASKLEGTESEDIEPLGMSGHDGHLDDIVDDFILNHDQEDLNHSFMIGMFEAEETGENALSTGRLDRAASSAKTARNPFLEVIAKYLEELDLPFQHADTWVPSLVSEDSDAGVRLLQAGSVTRQDQDAARWSAFENFGRYSESFSFAPGKGLVGRAYTSGKIMWEFGLNKLDPDFFHRAGGAEEYGVRTAVAMPFSTPGVGRMVVVLYSCTHIPEDAALSDQIAQELATYAPAPKWKLVVEMSDATIPQSTEHEDQSHFRRKVSMNDFPSPAGQDTFSSQAKHSSAVPSFLLDRDAAGVVTPRDISDHDVEGKIISLLGDQLANGSEGNFDDPSLFQELMRIRLLLLLPTNRRSIEDIHKIDVLKNSYVNYSMGGHRGGKEIAKLLAREWMFLSECSKDVGAQGHHDSRSSLSRNGSMSESNGEYKSHEFSPAMRPLSRNNSCGEYKSHEFSPAMQPLRSIGAPLFDLGKGMSAPPVQLLSQHPHDKVSPRPFKARSTTMLAIDHSIQSLFPSMPKKTFGSEGKLDEIDAPMRRAVSCGSALSGGANAFFF